MQLLSQIFHFILDCVLHLDTHLTDLVTKVGPNLTYAILFAIVFCETGLVITPFLPGDSLLFAIGALSAADGTPLNVHLVFFLLVSAAICGDNVNYHLGKFFGPRVLKNENSRIFKKHYLDKTHAFYEKYGGKTLILARFVPVVRTFAPFVAGVGAMSYRKFITNCVIGAVLWVGGILYAGHFFGNIPIVKKNFTIVVFVIIFLSILPGIIEFFKVRSAMKKSRPPA